MIATRVNAIAIETEVVLDNQLVIETFCNDYDHYKNLPSVVSYKGVICKKTGWSSDTNRACYKETDSVSSGIAYAENEKASLKCWNLF